MTTAEHQHGAVAVVRSPESAFVARGIRAGLIASFAMAMVMMAAGLLDRGFFAAPSSIWAFWAGPAAYAPTTFSVGFVLGAMGHMMNATILGIVFAFLAVRVFAFRGTTETVVAGTAFALVMMALMWALILPLGANGAIVRDSASLPAWALGHVAYGMVAGLLLARWR